MVSVAEQEAHEIRGLRVRDADLLPLAGKASVELLERDDGARERRVPQRANAEQAALPRLVDGEPFVEPPRNVVAEHGVLERDVGELVTEYLRQVRRVGGAGPDERENDEM